jgi:hypothetical protein
MSKKGAFLLPLIISSLTMLAQESKKDAESVKTKMDVFVSRTGAITKFTDTKLPNLKTAYGGAETRIRKINNGTSAVFFYQIIKEGKYSNSTASIEYADLLEVLKALKALQPEVEKDLASKPDYLENKFITVDGFQIGYYVSDGKVSWYLKLEKFGSDNTLFIDKGEVIESAFNEAKNKIDELKKTM